MADLQFVDFALILGPVGKEKQYGLPDDFSKTECYYIGGPHKQCVCLCSKYKEMYGRIMKNLNIVNLYRGISKLKLKIKCKSTSFAHYCCFCGSEWRI